MIEVSMLDTVLTITFNNKAHNPPTLVTWVCADREAYDGALVRLAEMDWISGNGMTFVARGQLSLSDGSRNGRN